MNSGSSISFKRGTLNGLDLSSVTDSSGKSFFITDGNAENISGIKISEIQSVSSATVFYGRSLVEGLDQFLTNALKSSGLINSGKFEINAKLVEYNSDLLDVDDKVSLLTERYTSQFTAMEQAVTSLKSTGDYMENLLDAWNKDD
jgi:flagellar hook-associated protein 2